MTDELPQVVAQIVNLPCRRLVIGEAMNLEWAAHGGLPARDTADCQSALRNGGTQP